VPHAGSKIPPHLQLSGKTSDIHCAPSNLFSRLSPSRLFPVSQTKTTLKKCCFQTTEEIKENAIRELHAITESAFRKHSQQWKKRWEWCIASTGDYFVWDSAYNAAR
jgi:hypothetical protein